MIRGNRILAGFVLAMLVAGTLSGAAAIADEGVDDAQQEEGPEDNTLLQLVGDAGVDGAQQEEAPEDDAVLELVADAGEDGETPPAEEPMGADPTDDSGDADSAGPHRAHPRPAPRGDAGGRSQAAAVSSAAQPGQDGQGQVEIDPESAAGACPGGTALKIDNLRSNGTFGPITISDFTSTSFTWTSTEGVSAVLVKDGGGVKTNSGGSSGSASSLGQDISHVIFCLGGDVPDVEPEPPAPCDADETMPGTQPCEPEPCDADETMPGTQPCDPEPCDADETKPGTQPCEPEPCDADETKPGTQPCKPAPCDADETMPGTQPCEPEPCDADETMPGTQPCAESPCDADEKMPGRQDCADIEEDVAGVQSDPEKPDDEDVQGAGLVAGGEPDGAPSAAQPMAAQPAVQGTILPFTGGGALPLLMIAMGFITAGGGAILIRRP